MPQVGFEDGYIITEDGVRQECLILIRTKDWLKNPVKFNYKNSAADSVRTGDIHTVKEFGVKNELKFVKARVEIDRSSNELSTMSRSKTPEFQEEILFLKVLIEGEATLYSYSDPYVERFFFSIDGSRITQLVYKKYLKSFSVEENKFYQEQLSSFVNCQGMGFSKLKKLNYSRKDLTKYFIMYNTCQGGDYTSLNKATKRSLHLTLKGGLLRSRFVLRHTSTASKSQEFQPTNGYTLSVGLERIISSKKNNWSVLLEPGYTSITIPNDATANEAGLTYRAVSLPIGLRYSFYFNKLTRIMLNAFWQYELPVNSEAYLRNGVPLEISMNTHVSFGLGLKYKRLLIEANFHPKYDILTNYVVIGVYKSDFRFALGYDLF